MPDNNGKPGAESRNRRRVEVVQVMRTEAARARPPTKHLDTEAFAKATGTSGPSNRHDSAAPVQVKRTEEARGAPIARHLGNEALAAAPNTSGSTHRRPVTVQVTRNG